MFIEESDVRNIIADVLIEATCVRVRKIAATHRLGQISRLRMLEEQKAWNLHLLFTITIALIAVYFLTFSP